MRHNFRRNTIVLVAIISFFGCSEAPLATDDYSVYTRASAYRYEGSDCTLIASNGDAHPFQCGVLLIRLKDQVQIEAINTILTEIGATVIDGNAVVNGYIMLRVPLQTEYSAIRRLAEAPQVAFVVLNFTGPAFLP